MRLRVPSGLSALFLFLLVAACSTPSLEMAPAISDVTNYRLAPGDSLRLNVYGEDKLSGEYKVGDSGSVALPLIGPIKATDLTVDEFDRAVAQAYEAGGFLTKPHVVAEVLVYRPFFILGEVNKPGQYPYIPGMTVSQAVATANGYTYRADMKTIQITHFGKKDELHYLQHPGAMVSPGDTIRIPERHF
jgi:polysaccharide export outer membrane protein